MTYIIYVILLMLGVFATPTFGVFSFTPFIGYMLYSLLFTPTFQRKSFSEKSAIWKERAYSVLRMVVQIVGVLTVITSLGVNIPYLSNVAELVAFLGGGVIDVAVDAVVQLIGIVLTILGFFIKSERFEARVDNPLDDYKLQ